MSYQHKEAFCLMQYRCRCGHHEVIWNSRDGVTPFSMVCPSCGEPDMCHINFGADRFAPDHKPHFGQRMWVTMTQERALYLARLRTAHLNPKHRTEDFIDQVAESIYHNGTAPDLVVFGYEIKEAA